MILWKTHYVFIMHLVIVRYPIVTSPFGHVHTYISHAIVHIFVNSRLNGTDIIVNKFHIGHLCCLQKLTIPIIDHRRQRATTGFWHLNIKTANKCWMIQAMQTRMNPKRIKKNLISTKMLMSINRMIRPPRLCQSQKVSRSKIYVLSINVHWGDGKLTATFQ